MPQKSRKMKRRNNKRRRVEVKIKSTPLCTICQEHKSDAKNRCATCHVGIICDPCYTTYLKTTETLQFNTDFVTACPMCRQQNVIPLHLHSTSLKQKFFDWMARRTCNCCSDQLENVLHKYPYLTSMKDGDHYTLMHHAALRGNSYGMERIFNSGGSFFVRDSFGETPLDLLRDFGFENDSDAE